jgi:hypothetical protein
MKRSMKVLLKLVVMFALGVTFIASGSTAAHADGALAINGNQGSQYGWAINYRSLGDADQEALNRCGSGCYIVFRFHGTCAAYAADQSAGSTIYGWAYDRTAVQAQMAAINYCEARGGTSCMVRVWGCDNN